MTNTVLVASLVFADGEEVTWEVLVVLVQHGPFHPPERLAVQSVH